MYKSKAHKFLFTIYKFNKVDYHFKVGIKSTFWWMNDMTSSNVMWIITWIFMMDLTFIESTTKQNMKKDWKSLFIQVAHFVTHCVNVGWYLRIDKWWSYIYIIAMFFATTYPLLIFEHVIHALIESLIWRQI